MFDFNQLMQMLSGSAQAMGGTTSAAGQAASNPMIAAAANGMLDPNLLGGKYQQAMQSAQGTGGAPGTMASTAGMLPSSSATAMAPQSAAPQVAGTPSQAPSPMGQPQGGESPLSRSIQAPVQTQGLSGGGAPTGINAPVQAPIVVGGEGQGLASGTLSPEGAPAAGAQEPGTFDKIVNWLGGGGENPEEKERFRKMNALMAMGTALGGAIAGPGTMVGDVSKELNSYAKGNIVASNTEQQQAAMNNLAKTQLSALGAGAGAGGKTGLLTPGANLLPMGAAAASPSGATPLEAPLSTPIPTAAPFSGISPQTKNTLSLDQLEENLRNISF